VGDAVRRKDSYFKVGDSGVRSVSSCRSITGKARACLGPRHSIKASTKQVVAHSLDVAKTCKDSVGLAGATQPRSVKRRYGDLGKG
jgi:hypothetical protein